MAMRISMPLTMSYGLSKERLIMVMMNFLSLSCVVESMHHKIILNSYTCDVLAMHILLHLEAFRMGKQLLWIAL